MTTKCFFSVKSHVYYFFVTVKPAHKSNSLISNQTVVEGRNAEFYCRTEAFPAATQYRWFKDDNQISNSADFTIDKISDAESRLTVNNAKKTSAGRYSCEGENSVGTGKKKSAFLLVNCK